jgi:hypothetical protein
MRKNPWPLNRGEADWGGNPQGESVVLIIMVDLHIGLSGLNPCGPVKSATLTLRGLLAETYLQKKEEDLELLVTANGSLLVVDGVAESSFEPDVLHWQDEVPLGDKVWLFFLEESATSREDKFPRMLNEGTFMLTDVGAFGRGLVLKAATSRQGGGYYSRVGTFRFQGAAEWEAWRTVRSDATVSLV